VRRLHCDRDRTASRRIDLGSGSTPCSTRRRRTRSCLPHRGDPRGDARGFRSFTRPASRTRPHPARRPRFPSRRLRGLDARTRRDRLGGDRCRRLRRPPHRRRLRWMRDRALPLARRRADRSRSRPPRFGAFRFTLPLVRHTSVLGRAGAHRLSRERKPTPPRRGRFEGFSSTSTWVDRPSPSCSRDCEMLRRSNLARSIDVDASPTQ
jgi:hypothetical protein